MHIVHGKHKLETALRPESLKINQICLNFRWVEPEERETRERPEEQRRMASIRYA